MWSFKNVAALVLFLLPIVCGYVILFRLSPYRRDGAGFLASFAWNFGHLRPDTYTDEGQSLLRWLWLWALLIIPWEVFVAVLVL
jgi:hypothetical protein